jgi:hypothetical protein
MARIARAVAAVLLLLTAAGAAGCLHTWTSTYEEYPESINYDRHVPQGNPEPLHP